MEYYQCPVSDLHQELRRRGHTPTGSSDQLSETLQKDDNERGSDATTIFTSESGPFVPRDVNLLRSAEFGETVPANSLVGEKIVYWTMNTFFPTLQLFFESGRSCTLDGGKLSDAKIGLDPRLRFRLTDCTYEEEGWMTKSPLPAKFAHQAKGLVIREAVVAQRSSIAVKSGPAIQGDMSSSSSSCSPGPQAAAIISNVHTVVGLRLEGMSDIAYVWAKVDGPVGGEGAVWGDVRITGLRTDVPAPVLGYTGKAIKPGYRRKVVVKESMIRGSAGEDDIEWILKKLGDKS